MVPEDRKTSGLFPGMDLVSNISATVMRQGLAPACGSRSARRRRSRRHFVDELRIATPSVRQLVGNLSGGNQQKVLLAKWLAVEPKLLIVDEPTRGVDVGARSEIYRLLRALADRGVALLVVSSDLPEVLALADRIIVMAEGNTVGELPGDTRDRGAGAAARHEIHRLRRRSAPRSGRCGGLEMTEAVQTQEAAEQREVAAAARRAPLRRFARADAADPGRRARSGR